MSHTDFTQRFLFDDADVRGEWTNLEQSYAEVLARHPYPAPVAQMLGEMLAAATLLVGTLKFDGLLVLQARSSGPLPLLMVECSSDREVRAIARYDTELAEFPTDFRELMPEGILTLTIDPREGKRYQGVVALDGETLADCLSRYFAMSEQLPTQFWLAADGTRARGLLLQQLPVDRITDAEERQNHWQHLRTLAETLTAEELLSLSPEVLLHRLYHEESIRLFNEQALRFHCNCSRERSARALVSLGEEDVTDLLAEQNGSITIDCQFCNQRYLFDSADVKQLFTTGDSAEPSPTQH